MFGLAISAAIALSSFIHPIHPLANNGYPVPNHAACVRHSNVRPLEVHNVGQSGLTWLYVTEATARGLHISRCSVVIAGNGQSVILTPTGKVVATS